MSQVLLKRTSVSFNIEYLLIKKHKRQSTTKNSAKQDVSSFSISCHNRLFLLICLTISTQISEVKQVLLHMQQSPWVSTIITT